MRSGLFQLHLVLGLNVSHFLLELRFVLGVQLLIAHLSLVSQHLFHVFFNLLEFLFHLVAAFLILFLEPSIFIFLFLQQYFSLFG